MSGALCVNEHPAERIVRVLVGVVLVGAAASGNLGGWAYLGVVPIVTGALGNCPLYTLLGISTCPMRAGSSK
ncbi:MAG: DUF2892 domain-containing protein [Vicinamibacterales bacterium]